MAFFAYCEFLSIIQESRCPGMFCVIMWPQADAPLCSNDSDFVRHWHPPFWMKERTGKESHPGSDGDRRGEEGHGIGKWGDGQMTEVGTMDGPEVHNHQLEQETHHRSHVPQASDRKAHWILLDKAFTEQCSGCQGERLLVTDRWTETLIHPGDTKTQTATGSAFADYM